MNKEELKQYIDQNIYENVDGDISGDSLNEVLKAIVDDGGTEVEANPNGEATEPLNKLKIGQTNYNIPQTDTSNLATKQELQQGLSGKQDTIADLEQIRTRANEGHTAVQPAEMEEAIDAVNPFAGEVEATDAERLQALANVSNQEAGYDESEPPVFTGKMGYVVLQPEKTGDATTTFAAQIANKPNTIFEIRTVFDLNPDNYHEEHNITILPTTSKIIGSYRYYYDNTALNIDPTKSITNKVIFIGSDNMYFLDVENTDSVSKASGAYDTEKSVYPAFRESLNINYAIYTNYNTPSQMLVSKNSVLTTQETIEINEEAYFLSGSSITIPANNTLVVPLGCIVLNSDGTQVLSSKDGSYQIYTPTSETIVNVAKLRSDAKTYIFSFGTHNILPSNCKLRFEGGMLKGEYCSIQGNNTLIESDSLCIKKGIIISGTWANDAIFTKWLEFVSVDDEYTDDNRTQLNPNPTNNYVVFKQLEGLINGTNGCKVEFEKGYYQCRFPEPYTSPEGTFKIDGTTYQMFSPFLQFHRKNQTYLYIDSLPYVDINLNGSTLKSLQHIYPRWSWITMSNINTSLLHDGIIKSFAAEFNYPEYCNHTRGGDSVDIYNISRNFEVGDLVRLHSIDCRAYNLTIGNTTGDAVSCGSNQMYTYSKGIQELINVYCNSYIISNCEFSYCGRNGISLHSSNYGTLESLHIHHIGSDGGNGVIGTDGIMGLNPRSGIDMEFEDDLGLHPVMAWNNLYIHDCGKNAFGFASVPRSTTKSFMAQNSIFEGRCQTMSYSTVIPVFENCKFVVSNGWTGFVGKSQYNNCVFDIQKIMTLGANTYTNCSFVDNMATNDYLFDIAGVATEPSSYFEKCSFNIKHKCALIHKVFTDCKIMFDKSDTSSTFPINAGGTSFIRCEIEALHKTDDVLDGYNVRFGNVSSNTEKTTFIDCSITNIKGTGSGIDSMAFSNRYGCIFKGCNGALRLFTGQKNPTITGNITIEECDLSFLYINGQNANEDTIFSIRNSTIGKFATDANMPAFFDKHIIEQCNITISDISYCRNFTIKDSNIIFPSGSSSYMIYPEIKVYDSVVTLNNSNFNNTTKGKLSLYNCYIKGSVSEKLYKGFTKDCRFENSIPTHGDSSSRPTASSMPDNYAGFTYFDETLGMPLYLKVDVDITDPDNPVYTKSWVKADGTTLT